MKKLFQSDDFDSGAAIRAGDKCTKSLKSQVAKQSFQVGPRAAVRDGLKEIKSFSLGFA